jgi:enediyne biosynthesis protein E4
MTGPNGVGARCALACVLMALAATWVGCDGGGAKNAAPAAATGIIRSRELPPEPPADTKSTPLHFTDVTRRAGITFRNETGSPEKRYLIETIGQGVALFDYDQDGDLDLYFTQGGEIRPEPTGRIFWNALYRNDGDWRFTDVTEGSGLESPGWSTGAYAADYDADGYDDMLVTKLGASRLYRNRQGSGTFEDVTDTVFERKGGAGELGAGAAFFDADGDDDLDLFVCKYIAFDPANPPNRGLPCRWKELEVLCGPRGLIEARNVFYEQVGGRFVEATAKFGFDVPKAGTYSLGVVTGDFDQDGATDLYVAVDSRPNLLFWNAGGGKFREVGHLWQVALNQEGLEQAGMGLSAADVNEDGWIDLFVTNFSHDTDTLYLSCGNPKNMYFSDATSSCGLGGEATFRQLSWGTGFYDFDCDGALDVFVACGHVYPQAEGVANLGTSYAQQSQLFTGTRSALKLVDRSNDAGAALKAKNVSRGTAFGDIDADGRMDIVVTHLDAWPTILRNESDIAGAWIGVRLVAPGSKNRSAIGARLTIECADGTSILREVHTGAGYLGTNDPTLHVAFAKERVPARLAVRWPDGSVESVPAPALGRYYVWEKGSGALREKSLPPPKR